MREPRAAPRGTVNRYGGRRARRSWPPPYGIVGNERIVDARVDRCGTFASGGASPPSSTKSPAAVARGGVTRRGRVVSFEASARSPSTPTVLAQNSRQRGQHRLTALVAEASRCATMCARRTSGPRRQRDPRSTRCATRAASTDHRELARAGVPVLSRCRLTHRGGDARPCAPTPPSHLGLWPPKDRRRARPAGLGSRARARRGEAAIGGEPVAVRDPIVPPVRAGEARVTGFMRHRLPGRFDPRPLERPSCPLTAHR